MDEKIQLYKIIVSRRDVLDWNTIDDYNMIIEEFQKSPLKDNSWRYEVK
jgi:hypothetical protein